jgi:phenylalanyl-tRNA synthetase beta chain
VRRDIALLVDVACPAGDLCNAAREAASAMLADVKVFDMYMGQGIDSNKKSIGLGLTFRDSSRTLTEGDVSQQIQLVLNCLERRFGAQQR